MISFDIFILFLFFLLLFFIRIPFYWFFDVYFYEKGGVKRYFLSKTTKTQNLFWLCVPADLFIPYVGFDFAHPP